MFCLKSAAEPSFGEHQAIVGALLSGKEDGEAEFLGGFLPLTWGGGRLLLHSIWQMLSATQSIHCCRLAGGEGGSGGSAIPLLRKSKEAAYPFIFGMKAGPELSA